MWWIYAFATGLSCLIAAIAVWLIRRREENLVAELLADFSDRLIYQEPVTMEEFLARCPNKRCQQKFLVAANICQLTHLSESVRKDRDLPSKMCE